MPSGFIVKLNLGFRTAIIARNPASFLSNNSTRLSVRRSFGALSMAASSPKPVFGDVYIDDMITTCGNGLEFSKPSGVFFTDKSRATCLKANMRMRKGELPNSRLVCGYSSFDAIRSGEMNNFVFGPLLKNFHTMPSLQFSAGAARDVSFEGNSREEQLANSTVVSGLYVFSSSVCSGYLRFVVIYF